MMLSGFILQPIHSAERSNFLIEALFLRAIEIMVLQSAIMSCRPVLFKAFHYSFAHKWCYSQDQFSAATNQALLYIFFSLSLSHTPHCPLLFLKI